MSLTSDQAAELLDSNDQSHLLRFWETLTADEKTSLLAQIQSLDFSILKILSQQLSATPAASAATDMNMQPAQVMPVSCLDDAEYIETGEAALRNGRVAALLVAGGQGTRLGYDGPKGSYGVGPVTGASLFQIHARKILALERRYETEICLCIMTSPPNDLATKEFFAKHDYFGLAKERVLFFVQGAYPTLLPDGKMVLDTPDRGKSSPVTFATKVKHR